MKKYLLFGAVMLLAACADHDAPRHVVDTVDVSVAILERAHAPKELFRPPVQQTEIPQWVAPTDPSASTCVTGTGEALLKNLLLNCQARLDGWEAYAH